MNIRDCPGRRAAFALLVAISLIIGFSAQIPQVADSADAVAAIPGHQYTTSELATYSKDQLIALVLSMQQEQASASTAALVQTDSQPHHSRLLGVIGEVLGGIGVAMLVGHMQSHNTGQPMAQLNMPTFGNPTNFAIRRIQPPGLAYSNSSFFSRERRTRPAAGSLPIASRSFSVVHPDSSSQSCSSTSQLFCNVDVTKDTCNSLQAAQGLVGALTPIWTGSSVAAGTKVDQSAIVTPNPSAAPVLTAASTQLNQQNLMSALQNTGYTSQQAAQISGNVLGGKGVALLGANGQPPTKTDASGTTTTYVSALTNFAFALSNIWVGCNNQVTTSTSPAPSPTSSAASRF